MIVKDLLNHLVWKVWKLNMFTQAILFVLPFLWKVIAQSCYVNAHVNLLVVEG